VSASLAQIGEFSFILAELPSAVDERHLIRHIVLVGYGRVGRRIGEAFIERGIPFVVVEQNREKVEALRERGIAAVSGDAAEMPVLIQAHVAQADMLMIAAPDALRAQCMIEIARKLSPAVEVIVRTHSEEEVALIEGRASAPPSWAGMSSPPA